MLWLLLWSCTNSPAVPSASASRGDLDVHLLFKGEFRARASVDIVNELDGWATLAFVAEQGSRVEVGDELIRFETEEQVKELGERTSARDIARTKVEQARARLALALGKAEAERVEAELDAELAAFRQTDSLTVPRVERQRSVIQAELARITTESATNKLDKVAIEARATIQLLELDVLIAEKRMERLQERIDQSTIRAKSPGVVLLEKRWGRETYRVGHEVYTGNTIMKLPDTGTLDVEAWVHEVDSPWVKVGQTASVSMEAHPDAQTMAVVSEVAPLVVPRGDQGAKHLRVMLQPETTTEKMKPGMTVQLDLIVSSVKDAVLVPTEAIFVGPQGPFVRVGAEAVPVEVVAEGEEQVAVEGIEVGTTVLTFDPEAWARGDRPPGAEE
jgi:multidrug resistance efflux pump